MTNNRRGFTLLEILIATGIFMTTMVFSIAIFTTTTSGASTSEQLRVNAQTARFVFESMAREIRLSRGLVQVKDETQIMLIPPFTVTQSVSEPEAITVYHSTRKGSTESGDPTYVITRKTYRAYDEDLDQNLEQLRIINETSNPDGLTVSEIAATLQTGDLKWELTSPDSDPNGINLLPRDLFLDKFHVIRYNNYPDKLTSIDTLQIQPYVQLELTVLNPRYNANRGTQGKIKTTLRTMIVPRDFVGKYEVVQPTQ